MALMSSRVVRCDSWLQATDITKRLAALCGVETDKFFHPAYAPGDPQTLRRSYETKKLRIPSWCDRVLVRPVAGLGSSTRCDASNGVLPGSAPSVRPSVRPIQEPSVEMTLRR